MKTKRKDDLKERILELLKNDPKSSTEIKNYLKKHYYIVLNELERMEENKLIERINVGKFTLWRRKK